MKKEYIKLISSKIIIVLFIIFTVSGIAQSGEQAPEEGSRELSNFAATVNGVGMTYVEFERSFNNYLKHKKISVAAIRTPEQYKQYQREVIDALIEDEVLWQEAKRKEYVPGDKEFEENMSQIRKMYPTEDAFLAQLRQGGYSMDEYTKLLKRQISVRKMVESDIVTGVSVTNDEVHAYYENNPDRFIQPEQVRARHILIKVDTAADQATQENARKKIEGILEEVKGGADFAEMAKKNSEGPSGPMGGDLGFFSKMQMVRPFADAAFALQPGKISDVVQTIYGFHIIKTEERRLGETIKEDEVREKLMGFLRNSKIQQAIQEKVKQLKDGSEIKILIAM